jgi:hypothetical protein
MASQRITIAKVGGLSADVVLRRLQAWSEARQTTDPNERSSEQWPAEVRSRADAFADQLRTHALIPPVITFIEWIDLWSMGDVFARWLSPLDGPGPFLIHANRFEIYGYRLPDDDRLRRHLATAGSQQFEEYDWFVSRLSEAVGAGEPLVDRAALVVLREVVGGLITDEELAESLSIVPDWISEI